MYAGVPMTLPGWVRSSVDSPDGIWSVVWVGSMPATDSEGAADDPGAAGASGLVRSFARPQSMTCTSPKAPTITLDGFRSRWITPRLWAKPTAWQTWAKT